jgi:two-component system LytT family response regulator
VRAGKRKSGGLGENIRDFFREMKQVGENQKISIPMREGFELLNVKDIIHLEASESYTMIHLQGGKRILSSKNIKVYEKLLDPNIFFRTHKSHIVNLRFHLKGFNRIDGNSAVMTNGQLIPISRRKLQSFLDAVEGQTRHD